MMIAIMMRGIVLMMMMMMAMMIMTAFLLSQLILSTISYFQPLLVLVLVLSRKGHTVA